MGFKETKAGPDYLNFSSIERIMNQLYRDAGEKILFSCLVDKKNSYNFYTKRCYVVTDRRLCTFNGDRLRRYINLEDLHSIVFTTVRGINKLVIKVNDGCGHDIKLKTPHQRELEAVIR